MGIATFKRGVVPIFDKLSIPLELTAVLGSVELVLDDCEEFELLASHEDINSIPFRGDLSAGDLSASVRAASVQHESAAAAG